MVFNSLEFAIFFPVAVLIYFIIPASRGRERRIWLLLCSYYFYICQGAGYALLLFLATFITYLSAFWVYKNRSLLAGAVISELSLLFFFKYFDFFCNALNINKGFDILLPVGISFYIFKSLSYIIDVYRGKTGPDRDFVRYALYVSFFPEILAGPISRAADVLPQFNEKHSFDYDRVRHGLLRMLFGYFVKLVIASRLSILVDLVYGNIDSADGVQLFTATIVYSVQIYCDFMSYSEIALGAGEVLGIRLHENFRQPFFAKSLSELWRRWHMSLMSWFRDYLYIPLGGSRKGKARKYVNILIVFTLSGLWHGAAFTYILWGFLSGLLQVIGEMTLSIRSAVIKALPLHNSLTGKLHSLYMRLSTFLLFSFTVIFFRSPTVSGALTVIRKIFTEIRPETIRSFDPRLLGLGSFNLLISCFLVLLLFIFDNQKERQGDIYSCITGSKWYLRWTVYFFFALGIILSANIGSARFIYFDF